MRDPHRVPVLALAHVMNLSGQAATIGHFVAAAGAGPEAGAGHDHSDLIASDHL
nr:hypothetical protein [Streptomyces hyaluromycini]